MLSQHLSLSSSLAAEASVSNQRAWVYLVAATMGLRVSDATWVRSPFHEGTVS